MTLIGLALSLSFPGTAGSGGPPTFSFQNDVLPVLSKVGCNQGSCHGSESGKGGFKLSLRGFAPELDYRAISLDLFSRRINLASPEESLILKKPTLRVPHQGGRVLERGSTAERIIREWLREGAPGPVEGELRPIGLWIEPGGGPLETGARFDVRVRARFSDGSFRDVTEWARYDSSDATVALVESGGQVSAVGPGLAAVSASYQDQVASIEVTVPYPELEPHDHSRLPRQNFTDELVIARWKELRLWPSPPAGDAAFLRRISLDLTGLLPSADEVRQFLLDPRPEKRERAIERLLESPAFADLWAHKWGDTLRVSREWLGEKAAWQFHRWLRDRIERNLPWDQVVRELVFGAGNSSLEGPPNYYRLQKVFNEPELWPLVAAETTAQTFLGVRIQCARCHNHPQDRWTQADYYGLASFFSQVASKTLPVNASTAQSSGGDGQVVIYDGDSGEINHPRLGRPLPPRTLDGLTMAGDVPQTRREFLARWVTAPGNPFFARATVNRIWRHFMGRGLVEPVDDFRASNPPTNRPLLDALARELVEHRFDLRHLMRVILQSQTYALSSTPTESNRADTRFYSHFQPRRLTAEGLFDVLGQVTGLPENFAGLPPDFRAQELPDTRAASAFLDAFGRPLRRLASCECERVEEPNLGQALELMNSSALQARLEAVGEGVDRLLESGRSDAAVLEEIYLRSLSRPPAPAEARVFLSEWEKEAVVVPPERRPALRREFFVDVLWAAINSKEFLFNH